MEEFKASRVVEVRFVLIQAMVSRSCFRVTKQSSIDYIHASHAGTKRVAFF